MRASHSAFVATLVGLATILSLGCDDDPTRPNTGAIVVTLATAGADMDPDGYSLSVDGGPGQAVGLNGVITIVGLRTGNHQIQLGGLAANCSVSGTNPLSVDVISRDTVTVAFSVSCVARTGNIQVTIATSGPDADPDGYVLSVDGGGAQAIPPNSTFTLTGLREGQHTLTLSGLATNCAVSPPNPQTLSVTFGATTTAAFTVSCVARIGSVRVVTTTTGDDVDSDGYRFRVGEVTESIATNGSVTIAGLREGQHSVVLLGVEANCRVDGGNSRIVNVTFGGTAQVAFAIRCEERGA